MAYSVRTRIAMVIKIGQQPDHQFDQPLGLLSDCHRRIEHFLQVLTMAEERTRGCALTASQRTDLEAAIRYFETAAPRHIADEELSLFPRLRACGDLAATQALETVARLEGDHRVAERHHQAVDTFVRRWLADGELQTADADALRGHLAALHGIYQQHIAIEDRELFPAATRLLSPTDIEQIGREMKARRTTAAVPTSARR